MEIKEDRRDYLRNYAKSHYHERFSMRVPPDNEEAFSEIRLYCKVRGISLTSFLIGAANEKISADPTWKDELRNLLISMQNAETQDTTD